MSGTFSRIFVALLIASSLNVAIAKTDITIATPVSEKSTSIEQIAQSGVDINTATAEEIAQKLNGVGFAKAKAIVAFRDEHGKFNSVDDLAKVKGIGSKLIERNRDKIMVN